MSRQRGFTLIELLLATVLMSVLMIGVLAVILRVSGPVPVSADASLSATDPAILAAARVLSDDLRQARTVEFIDGQVQLMSFGYLDQTTHERSQLPTSVRYYVQAIGKRSWLMRQQRALVGGDTVSVWTEPVAAGVTRVELLAPELESVLAEEEEQEPSADERWQLRLWIADAQEPAIDRALVLRRGLRP